MKYNLHFLVFVSVLVISCNKEYVESDRIADEITDNAGVLVLTANIDDEETKAHFSNSGGFYWDGSDRIALYEKTGDSSSPEKITSTDMSSADWRTATFTIPTSSLNIKKTYKAFYPASEGYTEGWDHVHWWVPGDQTQTSSDSFSRFYLISKDDSDFTWDGESTSTSVNFKLVGTIIRFLVYGGSDSEETVTSVSIEQTSETDSNNHILANGNMPNHYNVWSDNANRFKVTVTVSGYTEYANAADKESAHGIYALVIPNSYWVESSLTGQNHTFQVVTNKKTYTFTPSRQYIYEGGKIYDMPLNLQKATSSVDN